MTPDPDAPPNEAVEAGFVTPVPEPLHTLLASAVAAGATDIHVDPTENGKSVRLRVDGVIHPAMALDADEGQRLLNQVKVRAKFNIDKSFTPEEGLIVHGLGDEKHDIRVTVVPVGGREAIHFRLLSSDEMMRDIRSLGYSGEDITLIRKALAAGTGMILIAGATGVGKSTTLYALARALDLDAKVVVSIEDPVKYCIPHIRQLQVDERHGVTIYEGLRTVLRTDPDVVLVGEIRDEESAVTAARGALSGRLVLATVHASDIEMAIDALRQLSVPRYVLGVLAFGAGPVVMIRPLEKKTSEERRVMSVEERESAPLPDIPKEVGKADKRQPVGLILMMAGFFLIFPAIAVHLSMTYAELHTHSKPGIIIPSEESHKPPGP